VIWEWKKKDAQQKTKLTGRAVLLANSHTGEDPAREAGPNLRLLEAGGAAGTGRKKRTLFVFSCMRAICAGGTADPNAITGAAGACAKTVRCCVRGACLRGWDLWRKRCGLGTSRCGLGMACDGCWASASIWDTRLVSWAARWLRMRSFCWRLLSPLVLGGGVNGCLLRRR